MRRTGEKMGGSTGVSLIDRFVFLFVMDSAQKQRSGTLHDAPAFGAKSINIIVHS